MYPKGVSVIICCYNSAKRLPATLSHLAGQQIPEHLPWEIILVNNASTDNTAEVAKAEWAKLHTGEIEFTIIDEPQPGLSYAREKGIQTSKFEYLIFCDDDNWLDNHYVQIAFKILAANPRIAALGGQSIAAVDATLPDWFEASKNNYAVGKQADTSREVSYRKHLWGCGIIVRKGVYLKAFAGFPSLLTGRKGQELSSGEDSEMCMRFMLMGYELFYSDALKLQHYIPAERLNKAYSDKLMDGFIKAHALLSIYGKFIDLKKLGLKKKVDIVFKSALKTLMMAITGIKRWNADNEKLNLYILVGYKFKAISNEFAQIRQLSSNNKLLN